VKAAVPSPVEVPRACSAGRSLLWLSLAAVGLLVLLLWLLGFAAGVTGAGARNSGPGVDVASNTISLVEQSEPPQLDSSRTQDQTSFFVLGHVMEGLLRLDEHNQVVAGVAESWQVRADGATFRLRADARWSDGKPVTANDFVFAWRLLVDPANAGPYASLLFSLKNAEAIVAGKMKPEALGVSAPNDRLLEVTFENPIPYFEKLAAFSSLLPIREDFYRSRNGRYAANAEDLLFNGSFTLTSWEHGASFRLERNPNYWNKGRVKLDAVDVPYITTDYNAWLNLYRDNRIAMVGQPRGLSSESLKQALMAGWPIHQMRDGSVWYLQLNFRPGRPTTNRNLRKALQLVVDPSEFVNRVLKTPGYVTAASIFPVWLQGADRLFRQEYPAPAIKVDVATARTHLELAKKELGVSELPPLVFLCDDTPSSAKEAEYFQTLFKEKLGLEIRIDKQIFKQRIAKMQAGEFDLVNAGWGPDYDDPLTFGDLFASWNPNNNGKYNNPAMDRLVRTAQGTVDSHARMEAFGEIQRILIEDVALITTYERGQSYVQHPRLKGVVRRAIGTDPDFSNAYIDSN
jgi:oligopeptide transport system substrate-binding protein